MATDDAHRTPGWRREALWAAPVLIGGAIGTAALLRSPAGESVATILALPVALVGVVVAVLALRSSAPAPRTPPTDAPADGAGAVPPGRSPGFRLAALTVAGVLLGTAAVMYWWGRTTPAGDGPSADEYLSGRVSIGVNGAYPGWSDNAGAEWHGFDVELARWLAQEYRFDLDLQSITNPGDREPAIVAGRVKLVIANFTITDDRLRVIDMAGPYYRDQSGIWLNVAKAGRLADKARYPVCVAAGTTNETKLNASTSYVAEPTPPSLDRCLTEFFNPESDVALMVSDKSVLQGYVGNSSSFRVFTGSGENIGLGGDEQYGIGMPNGHSRLCLQLNDKIDEFIKKRWESVFNAELGRRGLTKDSHMPTGTSSASCTEPPR